MRRRLSERWSGEGRLNVRSLTKALSKDEDQNEDQEAELHVCVHRVCQSGSECLPRRCEVKVGDPHTRALLKTDFGNELMQLLMLS